MMHLDTRTKGPRIGAALWLAAAAWISVSGASASEPEPAPRTLAEIGMDVEHIRGLSAAERPAAIDVVSDALANVMKAGVEKDRRTAAHFLSGEIKTMQGRFEAAAEQYEKAAKDQKHNPFADDAELARIATLESRGLDDDAAKAWKKWEEKNDSSPLRPEVRLARCWNALRRGALEEASALLKSVQKDFTWMNDDPRLVLALATAAYLEGRPEDAQVILEHGGDGAGATYLRALCFIASGDVLKAAAHFQETAERFPDSPLKDHAMLAKANTFLVGGAYQSAAEEFLRVVELATRPEVQAEAELRHAASVYLAGDTESGTGFLQHVAESHAGTGVAARAQVLLGEVYFKLKDYDRAILELNRVLTTYFEHDLASGAQYRVGQCLDALGRKAEATGTYQAVVSGYPQTVEAPAAAYLAGVGLMDQAKYQAAVPYFQLVIDRYARADSSGGVDFASADQQELVEASLCLLELSYHRAGALGQLSGMPHLMLTRMPASASTWRAYALLIDSDAMAAQGRHEDAQMMLQELIREFPDHDVALHANRLLAWTYTQQGEEDLAIETESKMLSRYAARGDASHLASAYLNKAHVFFNRKNYTEAARAYEDFLSRFPGDDDHGQALYLAGLSYLRLNQTGDAADRWETLVGLDPTAPIAEKAWIRAGDVYFQAEHYDDAKRCYEGLLANFSGSSAAALGMLRLAQCEYNAGNDAEALNRFGALGERYPGSPEAREAERGIEMALYRLGQNAEGAERLAELVERYPTSSFAADAQFQIAMQQYQDEAYLEAADAFRRVVSQFPGYSSADRAYFLMGDAYMQGGSRTDAQTAYEQFLMFFAESELRSTVQFRLGMLRFEDGRYMQAAIDFTGVLGAEPADDVASASRFNLALCQRMLGQNEDARVQFEEYRKHYANDERAAEVAYQLSDIHDQAGRTELAVEELEKALAAGPTESRKIEINYRLGVTREALDDTDGALHAYTAAIAGKDKKDPFRLSAVARAAAIYEQQGKVAAALRAYRDLIKNSTDPELVAAAEERASELASNSPSGRSQ